MPKNKVRDLVTDQEMVFGRLILSGKMTDQQAAETAGLNPGTAAYTKSKPRVQAYMREHRARMQQQFAQQEAESLRRFHLGREQVLERLWEIAKISPELTRGSLTGQVKALSMIVAMEALIPDRRAGSAVKSPALPPDKPYIDPSAFRRQQQAETDGQGVPEAEPAPGSGADAPPQPGSIADSDGSSLTETEYSPLPGAADFLLRMPQNDRILSNFIKNRGDIPNLTSEPAGVMSAK